MNINQPPPIVSFDDDWPEFSNDSPWNLFGSLGDPAVDSRVCNRCILKKVKCGLQRPSCSRCAEVGHLCVYSSKKRKPGPPKGSIRKQINPSLRKISEAPTWKIKTRDAVEEQQPVNSSAPCNSTGSTFASTVPTAGFSTFEQPSITEPSSVIFANTDSASNVTSTEKIPVSSALQFRISLSQQGELLDDFLNHLNPAIGLFHETIIRRKYEAGAVDQNLLLIICAITIKILKQGAWWHVGNIDGCLEWLLTKYQLDEDDCRPALSIEDFQYACLVNFYCYYQQPGYKAWMRISQLSRKAYQYRLHQLDCGITDAPTTSFVRDKEEWRLVWWCIFRLDTHSNIATAAPFVIGLNSIKTALVPSSSCALMGNQLQPGSLIFLAEDTESISDTVYEIFSIGEAVTINMYIVAITIVREAAGLHTLAKQGCSGKLFSRLEALGQHIYNTYLALPASFTNMSRQILLSETPVEYNARLVCLSQLQTALLFLTMSLYLNSGESDRLLHWRRLLERVEILTSIVAHLDTQYLSVVEPSLAFLTYGMLGMLSVHARCELRSQIELRTSVEVMEDVLKHFLEGFAANWNLANVLLLLHRRDQRLLPEFLTTHDMDRMGREISGILNPESLQLLRGPSITLDTSVTSETEANIANFPDPNAGADTSTTHWLPYKMMFQAPTRIKTGCRTLRIKDSVHRDSKCNRHGLSGLNPDEDT